MEARGPAPKLEVSRGSGRSTQCGADLRTLGTVYALLGTIYAFCRRSTQWIGRSTHSVDDLRSAGTAYAMDRTVYGLRRRSTDSVGDLRTPQVVYALGRTATQSPNFTPAPRAAGRTYAAKRKSEPAEAGFAAGPGGGPGLPARTSRILFHQAVLLPLQQHDWLIRRQPARVATRAWSEAVARGLPPGSVGPAERQAARA